jgi:hypothetical protein
MKRCRLIYKSVKCPDLLSDAALKELIEKASLHNQKAGITGILLLSGDRFLQVLEGPVKFVNQLYGRIVADKRHQGVELISYESVSRTFFHDWSMKLVKLDDDLPKELRETLVNKYSERDGHIAIPDDLLHVHALLLDARWGLLHSGS